MAEYADDGARTLFAVFAVLVVLGLYVVECLVAREVLDSLLDRAFTDCLGRGAPGVPVDRPEVV